jgi:hypothetical protein
MVSPPRLRKWLLHFIAGSFVGALMTTNYGSNPNSAGRTTAQVSDPRKPCGIFRRSAPDGARAWCSEDQRDRYMTVPKNAPTPAVIAITTKRSPPKISQINGSRNSARRRLCQA